MEMRYEERGYYNVVRSERSDMSFRRMLGNVPVQETSSRSTINSICGNDNDYVKNNVFDRYTLHPLWEDALSTLRQRNRRMPQRRLSDSNLRTSSTGNLSRLSRQRYSIGTRDAGWNDVLLSSEIYANPLPLHGGATVSRRSSIMTSFDGSRYINSPCTHNCYAKPYYAMIDMFGLAFGLVLGLSSALGLLGLFSWLGLGVSLSVALLPILVICAMQYLQGNDEEQHRDNRMPRNGSNPRHYRKLPSREEPGYGSSRLSRSGTERSYLFPDRSINGVQDTATSSVYWHDYVPNNIGTSVTTWQVMQSEGESFLIPSPRPDRFDTSHLTTNGIYTNTPRHEEVKLAAGMKYTLNISEESMTLCLLNPENNPVASGVNATEGGIKIRYGDYEITVGEK